MSCADELDYLVRVRIPERQRSLDQARARRDFLSGQLTEYNLMIAALQARGVGGAFERGASAVASSVAQAQAAAPAQRQATTQPQEERRGGDGDLAQYASLLRDIQDMEGRLDKLEAR